MTTWLDGTTSARAASNLEARVDTRVYNVKAPQYGAKGDGVTDDTAAIQAALDAAYAAGGGVVYCPPGLYITNTIRINSYVMLRGAGIEATTLRLKAGSTTSLLMTVGFEALTGTVPADAASGPRKFHVREIKLDANKAGGCVAWAFQVFGVGYTVDHVEFWNGKLGNMYSEWRSDTGGEDMETFVSNFKCKEHSMGTAIPGSPTTGNGSYGIWWRGPHDTFFSNGVVATLDSAIRPENNPYCYGIFTDAFGGASGELFSNVHVWGRHHYGFFPWGNNNYWSNCVSEGAFNANLMLTSGSVWSGGTIYGNNGFSSDHEVGIQVGTSINDYNCSRAMVIGCFMTNFDANGRWIDFQNGAGSNRFIINGHSDGMAALYKGAIFWAQDEYEIISHNNPTISVVSRAKFTQFQNSVAIPIVTTPTLADPALDYGRASASSVPGALIGDSTAKKLWMVMADGYRGVPLRLSTDPQNLYGAGSPEGVVTAVKGSTWNRTDGGAATSFYVKESGTGNTGWIAK